MTRSQRTTRLQRLLLAGTLLPLLAISPSSPGFAQAPDQLPGGEHHPPRARDGEPRGGGPREPGARAEHRQGGADRQQSQQETPHTGPRAERGGEAEGAQHGRKARAAGAEPGAPASPPASAAPAARADDSGRASRKKRDEANPAAAAAPTDADRTSPRQADDERGSRRERRAKGGDTNDRAVGDRAAKDRDAQSRGERKGGKDDAAARDDERGPDRRDRAGDPDRRPADRTDAQRDERRDRPRDAAGTPRSGDRPRDDDARRDAPVAGNGRGLAAGFLPPAAGARRLDDIRAERRETRDGDRLVIREPGRTIVQEKGRAFIVHDETDRFRALGLDVRRERRGADFVDTARRPNGDLILTFTDPQGRLLRRVRRGPDGRDVVLIDNGSGGRVRSLAEDVVVLPPPPMRIPRDRYIVDYRDADAGLVYDTLVAPPLAPPPRRYTLDQIRYSPDVRSYIRQVDINTINFDTGSWAIPDTASGKLEALATALKRAIGRNPNSVFLVEGFTDAVGNADDNLSLSDRRAQSVAEVLTRDFNVPPENLTTQGYGEQDLKENTQGPSAANRRVVVQNITPLLAAGGDQPEGQ